MVQVTSNGGLCPLSFSSFLKKNNNNNNFFFFWTQLWLCLPHCLDHSYSPFPGGKRSTKRATGTATPPTPASAPPSQNPLFLFLWNKQYSLALFDPLTMQGLHVWPVFLDQQVVAGKLLKGSSFFSLSLLLSAPHTQMGTCWTLPKVSAKLHILWILALAQAFERAHRIVKRCEDNNYPTFSFIATWGVSVNPFS